MKLLNKIGSAIKNTVIGGLKVAYNAAIPNNMVSETLEAIGGIFNRSNPPKYLTYEVTTYSIDALYGQKKSISRLSGDFSNYKKRVGKFSDIIIDEFKDYGLILVKFLFASESDFNEGKLKEKCKKCLKEIIKKCKDPEIVKLTYEEYKKFVESNEQNVVDVEHTLIGDFAIKLKECAEETINLLDTVASIEDFNKEIFVEGNTKKDYKQDSVKKNIVKTLSDACKTNFFAYVTNKLKKVKDHFSVNPDDMVRTLGKNITAGLVRLTPVEYYKFGEYLSKRSAVSVEHILSVYSKALRSYPEELNSYKTAGIEHINGIVKVLQNYISCLKSLSKPKLSNHEKLVIRQNVKDSLALLQSVLKNTLDDKNVTHVKSAGGKPEQKIEGGGKDFGVRKGYDPEKGSKIIIDGWALPDFLNPMKLAVEKTLTVIDTYIPINGEVDYEALEIKNPHEKDSKKTEKPKRDDDYKTLDERKKKDVKLQKREASAKNQKLDEISKQRKNLVKILEEAISIFTFVFKQRQEVDKAVNRANFASKKYKESYVKLKNEVLKKYDALCNAYSKLSKPSYNVPDMPDSVNIALIEKDALNREALNVFDPSKSKLLSPDNVLKELYSVTAQCLNNLSEMRSLAKQIDEINKYLIRTFGTASKEIVKNRAKLTDLLEQIIKATNSAYEKSEDIFKKFEGALGAVSDDRLKEFNSAKKEITDLRNELINKWYVPICSYNSNGQKIKLVDENDNILTGGINSLSLNELTDKEDGHINVCLRNLSNINKISADMDKLEKQIVKNFGAEAKQVEKARAEASELLKEATTIHKNIIECWGISNNVFKTVDKTKRTVSLANLYKTLARFNIDAADKYSAIIGALDNSMELESVPKGDEIPKYMAGLKLENLESFIKKGNEILPKLRKINKEMKSTLSDSKKKVLSVKTKFGNSALRIYEIAQKIAEFINYVEDTFDSKFDPKFEKSEREQYDEYLKKYVTNSAQIQNKINDVVGRRFGKDNLPFITEIKDAPGHYEANWDNIFDIVKEAKNNKSLKEQIKNLSKEFKELQGYKKSFDKGILKFEEEYKQKVAELKNIAQKIADSFNGTEARLNEFKENKIIDAGENDFEIPLIKKRMKFLEECEVIKPKDSKLVVNDDFVNDCKFPELCKCLESCKATLQDAEQIKLEINNQLKQKSQKRDEIIKKFKDHLQQIVTEWNGVEKLYNNSKTLASTEKYQEYSLEIAELINAIKSIKYLSFDEAKGTCAVNTDINETISKLSNSELSAAIDKLDGEFKKIKDGAGKVKSSVGTLFEEVDKRSELREKAQKIIDIFQTASERVASCVGMDGNGEFTLSESLRKKFTEMFNIIENQELYFIEGGKTDSVQYAQKIQKVFPKYFPPIIDDDMLKTMKLENLKKAISDCDAKIKEIEKLKKELDEQLLKEVGEKQKLILELSKFDQIKTQPLLGKIDEDIPKCEEQLKKGVDYDFGDHKTSFENLKQQYLGLIQLLKMDANLSEMSLSDLKKLKDDRNEVLKKLEEISEALRVLTKLIDEEIKNNTPLLRKLNELLINIKKIKSKIDEKIKGYEQVRDGFRQGNVFKLLSEDQKLRFNQLSQHVEQNVGPYKAEMLDSSDFYKKILNLGQENWTGKQIRDVISEMETHLKDMETYSGGVKKAIDTFNDALEKIKEEVRVNTSDSTSERERVKDSGSKAKSEMKHKKPEQEQEQGKNQVQSQKGQKEKQVSEKKKSQTSNETNSIEWDKTFDDKKKQIEIFEKRYKKCCQEVSTENLAEEIEAVKAAKEAYDTSKEAFERYYKNYKDYKVKKDLYDKFIVEADSYKERINDFLREAGQQISKSQKKSRKKKKVRKTR